MAYLNDLKMWLGLILMVTPLHHGAAVNTGKKKNEAVTHLLFPSTPSSTLAPTLHCGKGQFMGEVRPGVYACFPCPDKTYQDEDVHTLRECKLCKKVEKHNPFEQIRKKCTATSDTEIECARGYYYCRRGRENECKKCKICALEQNRYTGRNCTNNTDTVCCEHPDMVVIERESEIFKDFVCVNQTTISTTTSVPTTTTTITSPTKEISDCDGAVFRSNGCLSGESPVLGCDTPSSGVLCKPNPGRNESGASTLSVGEIVVIVVALVVFILVTAVILYVCRRRIKSECMKICNRRRNQHKFSPQSSSTKSSLGPDSEPDSISDLLTNSEVSHPV